MEKEQIKNNILNGIRKRVMKSTQQYGLIGLTENNLYKIAGINIKSEEEKDVCNKTLGELSSDNLFVIGFVYKSGTNIFKRFDIWPTPKLFKDIVNNSIS